MKPENTIKLIRSMANRGISTDRIRKTLGVTTEQIADAIASHESQRKPYECAINENTLVDGERLEDRIERMRDEIWRKNNL